MIGHIGDLYGQDRAYRQRDVVAQMTELTRLGFIEPIAPPTGQLHTGGKKFFRVTAAGAEPLKRRWSICIGVRKLESIETVTRPRSGYCGFREVQATYRYNYGDAPAWAYSESFGAAFPEASAKPGSHIAHTWLTYHRSLRAWRLGGFGPHTPCLPAPKRELRGPLEDRG